jgi:hypothetical protein
MPEREGVFCHDVCCGCLQQSATNTARGGGWFGPCRQQHLQGSVVLYWLFCISRWSSLHRWPVPTRLLIPPESSREAGALHHTAGIEECVNQSLPCLRVCVRVCMSTAAVCMLRCTSA